MNGFHGGKETYSVRATEQETTFVPHHYAAGAQEPTTGVAARLRTVIPGTRASVDTDGSLVRELDGVSERLRNLDEGLEQSWTFESRPKQDGDLVLRVAVEGVSYVGETHGALHFADPTGLGFRYGDATWIDATGARTPLYPEFSDGEIRLRVPASIIEHSMYPAVLDPTIGPEFLVDAPVLGPHYNDGSPTASFDGTNYLVIWLDGRAGGGVFGTRVSQSGTILDTSMIPIAAGATVTQPPTLAYDGKNWLVAYYDSKQTAVYGVRVSSAGAVLDATPFFIAAGQHPRVAFDGTNYLVVEDQVGAFFAVYGQLVKPDSTRVGTQFVISASQRGEEYPDVAWNGATYLVAWAETNGLGGTIFATTVSSSGAVGKVGGTTLGGFTTPGHVAVASDGTKYFLTVWSESYAASPKNCTVQAALVDGTGAKLGQSQLGSPGSGSFYDAVPHVTYGSGWYAAAWNDQSGGIYGTRVSVGGVALDPTPIQLANGPSTEGGVAITAGASGYFAVWTDSRNVGTASSKDIYAARLAPDLIATEASGFLVNQSPNLELQGAGAFNGTNYLVLWSDGRNGGSDIYGSRISPSGTLLDPSAIEVSRGVGGHSLVAVASNGHDFFGVWDDSRQSSSYLVIYGARITASGSVQDVLGIPITTVANDFQQNPSVASDCTNYLVVWDDGRNFATTGNDIYAARVDGTGTVLDPAGIPINTAAGDQSTPRVAYDGSVFFVIWDNKQNRDVRGVRVDSTGAVLDATPVILGTNRPQYPMPTSLAGGTGNFVATMVTLAGNNVDPRVYTYLVGNDGKSQGGVIVSKAPTNSTEFNSTATAWDGTQFWTAFDDESTLYGPNDLLVGRVTPLLGKLDGTGIDVTNSPTVSEQYPALVGGPLRQVLMLYTKPGEVTSGAVGVSRVYARLLSDLLAQGAACTTGAACGTGHCVDGVCCDAACDGLCEACTATKKGSGADGTCGAIGTGKDPDSECTASPTSTCGTDGYCDGARNCRLYGTFTSCGTATCNANAVERFACDGLGTCVGTTGSDCAPYACGGGACKKPCGSALDCVSGRTCVAGSCVIPQNGDAGAGGAATGTGGAASGTGGATGAGGTTNSGGAGSGGAASGTGGDANTGGAASGSGGDVSSAGGTDAMDGGRTSNAGGAAANVDGGSSGGGATTGNGGGATTGDGGGATSTSGGAPNSGSGGAPSSGGNGGGTAGAGTSVDGGAVMPKASSKTDPGCGCRVPSGRESGSPVGTLAVFALLGMTRRRKRMASFAVRGTP
ncbi:MAG TPA: hypothetical protein VHE30_25610 [Polyangiaceae bacterium]|nr:hypothetical protein [Polyangiaceae bacterium]